MQGYYKAKIADIEKEYTENRDKRENRLKERIENLEKEIKELKD
jgi:ParB family chromosome partitioning protein